MKLPKPAIPLPKPDNNPVSIVVDDNKDDVKLDAVKSGNPTTSNIIKTPTKKVIKKILSIVVC